MSLARPVVSVVMANYNGARHVARAVRSVLDQTLRALELIVVDDGSNDDSLEVIARAAQGDRRVRVLRQAGNAGPAAARNRALDAARGRWIAILDSDDLISPDRLRALTERGEADGAQIVVDNLVLFSDETGVAPKPLLDRGQFAGPRWIGLAEFIDANHLYGRRPKLGYLKPVIHASVLGGVRYQEELRIGEDYDLVLRLLIGGARMRLDPRAFYLYRKHGASISHVIRAEHIQRMIEGDLRLAAGFARQPAAVRRAQKARMASLHRALAYDRLIEHLKTRAFGSALSLGLSRPDIWPLLMLPLTARAKSLAARLEPPAAAGPVGGVASEPPGAITSA